jgi:nucleotide-binding universal stress UspA family protein
MLVPLDGSELANAVLPYVEAIGKALGWSVVLLRVVEGDPARRGYTPLQGAAAEPLTEPGVEATNLAVTEAEEASAYDSLKPAAERLRAAGLNVEREVGSGRPRDVISGRANASDIALVVMASHGRTGLARLFRGSVAAGVVDDTPRPVLVVRPFRDQESRVDLEHAERLPAGAADSVRQAVDGVRRA